MSLDIGANLYKELTKKVDEDIIAPVVTCQCDWIHLYIMREKPDGRLHIYLNPGLSMRSS